MTLRVMRLAKPKARRWEKRTAKRWVMATRSGTPTERNSVMEKRSVKPMAMRWATATRWERPTAKHSGKRSATRTAKRSVMATRSGTPTERNSVMEKRSVKPMVMRWATATRWENCSDYSKATNSVPDPGPYVDFLHKRQVLLFFNLLVKPSDPASFL